MRRLNDTAALAERSPDGELSHSISSRKVGDGYVVNSHTYNASTGESRCDEQYYKEPPKIVPGRVSRGMPVGRDAAGSRGLSDTMSYLANKGGV